MRKQIQAINESSSKSVSRGTAIALTKISPNEFDKFEKSIVSGGIFGQKLDGYKTEKYGYRAVKFIHTRDKSRAFFLTNKANVKIDSKDVYYAIGDVDGEVILIWEELPTGVRLSYVNDRDKSTLDMEDLL
jgi:hypothetical protein